MVIGPFFNLEKARTTTVLYELQRVLALPTVLRQIHLIIPKTVFPFSCFLNKEITSIENNRLIFKPCNCNFLLKLQSNDYRHEVELDNNAKKEHGDGGGILPRPPGTTREGGRYREKNLPAKNENSLTPGTKV